MRSDDVELRFSPTLSDSEYALLISRSAPWKKAAVLARSAARASRVGQGAELTMVHRLLTLTPVPFLDPPRRLDVYDFDDALVVGSAATTNRRFQWTKQEGSRALACMRRARLVVGANPTLAGQARQYARRVEVVPSCVDPEAQPLREHVDREVVTIGWIGSHTTVGYLEPLLPVIERLNARGHRSRLIVVGGDTGIRADWLEHRPWSLASAPGDIADFDIGVMPLPDTPWTQGKSGYKLLQYFAAGVPAVASPVGVNAEFVADGRGVAATAPAEWEHALIELRDSHARRERGLLARRFVEEHYSYQRWSPELATLLRSLH